MADYIWQLGIDWNAIQTGGVSYLRGGLLKKVSSEPDVFEPSAGTAPVHPGAQIIFQIFDVSSSVPSGRRVTAIGSFGIDSQAAVEGQTLANPLDILQPAITQDTPPTPPAVLSSPFGDAYCSWTSASSPVTVTATAGRFLLTIYLQATGPGDVERLFNHDPEMVVGEN